MFRIMCWMQTEWKTGSETSADSHYDGEDAKDLDDAISLTKEGAIYHLGVHIADVSNYVQYNSALDREALKRGTSVYLADRVCQCCRNVFQMESVP